MRLEVRERGSDYWIGSIDGEDVAEFEFTDVHGDGRMWLTHAEVTRSREGIGSEMIRSAVEQYGEVWASMARQGDDYFSDTRWLTVAGANLVNACVRNPRGRPRGRLDRSQTSR